MEELEPRCRNLSFFCGDKKADSFPVCQKCEACILAWQVFSTKEWFQRISEISQRRFLVNILVQLDSMYLLNYFQSILQTTQGKDAIYNRTRISIRKEGKIVTSSLSQVLDKAIEEKMKEILYWFRKSTHQTKANYTLLLLQMCEPKLLLTAANVIRNLFMKDQNSEIKEDSNNLFFFSEKNSQSDIAFGIDETNYTSVTVSKTSEIEKLFENVGGESFKTGLPKDLLQCISKMDRLFSEKANKSFYAHSDLLITLEAIGDLTSGSRKYCDFIHYLPVHLSKYILGMLSKSTLNRCACVSKHWAILTQQVKMELSMHTFLQNKISYLQGSYTKGVDPTYANKLFIPVPKMVDDAKYTRVKNQKWKLRTKSDYNLWTAYQNQETELIQMEERNVFCGTYNVRILCDMWNPNRVIHYSGGDFLAFTSNRKIYLLNIIKVKKIHTEFRGHAGSIRTIILCEKEHFLLSGSYDLSIRYWDLKNGACIRVFSGHHGTITCMDICKNMLVSGARDCQIKEWDLDTGKCLKTLKQKDPILAIRINDTYIVSGCERGIVKVWNIVTAQLIKSLFGHEGAVRCLYFDQWHLLSGSSDGLVMAWSMVGKYERCLMAFKHPKEVLHVVLLFLRVISACADGKIRIYNFLNGNCLKVIKVNGRGDPVLSFFIQGNRMVINTESNVLLFQFENIKWQYSVDRVKQKKDREDDKEENGLSDIPSKSSTQGHSVKDSRSSKYIVAPELFSSKPHKTRTIQRTSRIQAGKGLESDILKSSSRAGKNVPDDGEKVQNQEQLEIPMKKSWKIPMSPDRFLLTVNALQKAHHAGTSAYPHQPHSQTTGALGPSILYSRKVLSFKGKSVQPEVDRLRSSYLPIHVKQTNMPLEIQKLKPNLKKSLHSPQIQSSIPQPMIIHSTCAGDSKGKDQTISSTDRTGGSYSPLTSMHVIKSSRMLAPPGGTVTQSLKKEKPHFYPSLDPFRMNTEFMLLTVKEENEYREAKLKEYQATKTTGKISPEKASRIAWLRKIKGLPIDTFMKQGKIAAPELGQNVFI
ncbi:F-box and WD repeat domain containing protein 10B [Sorex araneus]|uniref:F-box and WD repeat domain containing protein 10B n=1 Tax=Sorex araneus TaxID=42254 RepID=UPI002433C13D|nr:F-box and WD repeat domain containing protein 10B [Sorex araneus]